MKKQNLIALIVMLLLVATVLGQEPPLEEEKKSPEELFKENPTPSSFNQLLSPTVADLKQVPNPTIENFQKLPPGEQRTYLSEAWNTDFAEAYVQDVSFDEVEDRKIAERFFSENPEKVYPTNKEHFERYTEKDGISIKVNGNVKFYKADGMLGGVNGQINIKDFKDKFNFEVDERGQIVIYAKKRPGTRHTFLGNIEYSEGGTIRLDDGEIDRLEIIEGDLLFSFP